MKRRPTDHIAPPPSDTPWDDMRESMLRTLGTLFWWLTVVVWGGVAVMWWRFGVLQSLRMIPAIGAWCWDAWLFKFGGIEKLRRLQRGA